MYTIEARRVITSTGVKVKAKIGKANPLQPSASARIPASVLFYADPQLARMQRRTREAAGGAERQPAGAGGTAVAPVPADLGSPGMAAAELPPAPGTVVRASPATGLVVATGCGCLRLTHVQPAGRSAMTDSEFLRGHAVRVGERLGDDG